MGLLEAALRRVFGLVRLAAATAGGFAGLGFTLVVIFQRKLVYVPSLPGAPRDVYQFEPKRFGLRSEELWLRTSDGVKLHAWLCSPGGEAAAAPLRGPTVLFFQENAGNISHRLQNVKYMIDRLTCNVLIVSYRGFGKSDGSPSEKGLQLDAQAALDYLNTRSDLDRGKLVAFGRSLGGAVAAALAASNPGALRAVVLENTFTSIPDMAGCLLPLLAKLVGPGAPLNFLVRDTWRTASRIAQIAAPLLLICSGRDEMVPPAQMRRLRDLASPRSVWLELPQATHMDAWAVGGALYWGGLLSFLRANGCYEEAPREPKLADEDDEHDDTR